MLFDRALDVSYVIITPRSVISLFEKIFFKELLKITFGDS